VLSDGAVLLSGGRYPRVGTGIFLWLNADGSGKTWEKIDLEAHHNRHAAKEDFIVNTSCYTTLLALDEKNLLCIYDRWSPDFRAWVVRIQIE